MDPVGQDVNLNSPNKGLPVEYSSSLADFPVEGAQRSLGNPLSPGLTEEEAQALQNELAKVEEEISTLRQVLSAKERHAAELKRKLGLSPLNEFKQNLTKSWQDVQTSNPYVSASATLDDITHSEAYKKTQETLSQAGQKTTAALTTMSLAISRKLGDMRNSATFKSFEDKVGNLKVALEPSTLPGRGWAPWRPHIAGAAVSREPGPVRRRRLRSPPLISRICHFSASVMALHDTPAELPRFIPALSPSGELVNMLQNFALLHRLYCMTVLLRFVLTVCWALLLRFAPLIYCVICLFIIYSSLLLFIVCALFLFCVVYLYVYRVLSRHRGIGET
ncbi:tumor protein D54-like isoform X5 [Syngnathus typhle]|uniref:tumor protein D54-like isoform X5 n=1 Tax=Syngnathus typhle TaxID=161592 RepID=UPI002A6A0728|nr:tumor protein D54-like isoform X5 [Syngnathus typhle]